MASRMLSPDETMDIVIDSLRSGLLEIIQHRCKHCDRIVRREYKWNGENLLLKASAEKEKAAELYGDNTPLKMYKE